MTWNDVGAARRWLAGLRGLGGAVRRSESRTDEEAPDPRLLRRLDVFARVTPNATEPAEQAADAALPPADPASFDAALTKLAARTGTLAKAHALS